MAGLLLEIVEGAEAGRQHRLDAPVEIGREADGPLQLDDRQVSRRHARVTPREARAWVEDLGSTNGTFVNGARVTTPRRLGKGDVVRVGQSDFKVEL